MSAYDILTCPQCPVDRYPNADPNVEPAVELAVEWTAWCSSAGDEGPGEAHQTRWKVGCGLGHVLIVSDDVHDTDEDEHPAPSAAQIEAVGVRWHYDREARRFVRGDREVGHG